MQPFTSLDDGLANMFHQRDIVATAKQSCELLLKIIDGILGKPRSIESLRGACLTRHQTTVSWRLPVSPDRAAINFYGA